MQQPSTAEVRAWARERGFPVGDRGRLSPGLVARYVAERGSSGSRRGRAVTDVAAVPVPRRSASAKPPASPAGGTVRARSPWNWPALEQQAKRANGRRGKRSG